MHGQALLLRQLRRASATPSTTRSSSASPASQVPTDAASQAGFRSPARWPTRIRRRRTRTSSCSRPTTSCSTNDHLSLRYNRQKFTGGNFENGNASNALAAHRRLAGADRHASRSRTRRSSPTRSSTKCAASTRKTASRARPTAPIRKRRSTRARSACINIGRNTFSPRETTIKRHQIADTLTDVIGSHTVKGGFDVNQDKILNYFPGNFFGSYRFNSLADFQNGNRRQLPAGLRRPGHDRPDHASRHDRVRRSSCRTNGRSIRQLTLNAGLRYDFQKIAQPSVQQSGRAARSRPASTPADVPEDHNNIGPRLGFAWTPNTASRTVVRGGYGIFYGRTPAIMIGTAHSNNGINVQTLTFTGALIPTYPNIYTVDPDRRRRCRSRRSSSSIRTSRTRKCSRRSLGVERGLTNDIAVSASRTST